MISPKNSIALLLLAGMVSVLNAGTMKSQDVYTKMCSLCHGVQGQGNPNVPDAPALNSQSMEDLVVKLSDIKGKNFDNAHAKMADNQKIIEMRGMKYNAHEMAAYIHKNFNKDK